MAKAAARVSKRTSPSFSVITTIPPTVDALVVALFEKTATLPEDFQALDKAAGGALSRAIALGDFKGKVGSVASMPLQAGVKRLMLVGLGKRESFDIDNVRWAAASAAKFAKGARLGKVVLALHGELPDVTAAGAIGQAISEGATLGLFAYDEFKKGGAEEEKRGPVATTFEVFSPHEPANADLAAGLAAGVILGEAANYTRWISCQPGNVINPQTLVAESVAFARREKLRVTVIDAKKAAALGMGGIVAVGKASATPPALIVLEYVGPGAGKQQPIAVVGKAVTFDTGGISIKPSADMDAMKYDKCGGTAVLGIMQAVARLKLPIRVVGLIPTAENTLSGDAYRPGDILRFFNGKTAEITNTDAEGRLILADALAYAAETYKPRAIIDLATLTGGVVVALGSVYAGLFSNDDELAMSLESAGQDAGEWLWRLPLHERYNSLMDGHHADLVNSGPRGAHPVQGAVFLQHFVPKETPWAHLDIAGTAFPSKDDRYLTKGATGFGVRVVTEYLRRQAEIR